MKAFLTITSLATLALLGVAAAQESYFSEWRSLQRDYREILLSKAEDEGEVRAARGFSVEIRQIVVSDLDRVDRCITCHLGLDDPRMADVEQPFATHPGSYLEDHDMDKVGCTSCHLGQGLATGSREAHAREADVFWDRPLLPAPFIQSSCGVCHDPEYLGTRGAAALASGFSLFRSTGCLGCHKLGERGGPLGPTLDGLGDKGHHAFPFAHLEGERNVWTWHVEHLRDPATVVPGSLMTPTDLDDDQLASLATYLMSLRTSNLTERLTPRDRYEQRYQVWHTPPLSGAELYQQFCYSCHFEGLETVLHDTLETGVPSILNPDFLAVSTRDFLIDNIRRGRPQTSMPAWGGAAGGLTDEEIERLADYMLSHRAGVREITFVPSDGDPANGDELFQAECVDCHALTREGGDGPWLGDPVFQETYSDALIGHNIVWGREGTLMIPFGEEADGYLTDQEVSDLIAYIRTLK